MSLDAEKAQLLTELQQEIREIVEANDASPDLGNVCHIVDQLNEMYLPSNLKKRKAALLGILQSQVGRLLGNGPVHDQLEEYAPMVDNLCLCVKELRLRCIRKVKAPLTATFEADADRMLLEATELRLTYDQYWTCLLQMGAAARIDSLVKEDGQRSIDLHDQLTATLEAPHMNLDDIRRMLMSKKRFKVQKPVLGVGDFVNARKGAEIQWDGPGTIESRTDHTKDHGYGPVRSYEVREVFAKNEDGEYTVFEAADYDIQHDSMSTRDKSKWIGVRHMTDKDSPDPWAGSIGWYCALIDGVEEHFTSSTSALRAHDAQVIARKLFDLKVEDVYMDRDWDKIVTHLSCCCCDRSSKWAQKLQFQTRLHLILSRERSRNNNMKKIGDLLLEWSIPKYGHDEEVVDLRKEVEHSWKKAMQSCRGNLISSAIEDVRTFSLLQECLSGNGWSDMNSILISYIKAKGDLTTFVDSVPIFQQGYIATQTKKHLVMKRYLQENAAEYGYYMSIEMIDSSGEVPPELHIHSCDEPLNEFLVHVAVDKEVELFSLRVQHNGRSLFLSDIGKKSARELQMKSDDVIKVSYSQQRETEKVQKQTADKPNHQKQRSKAKKKHKAKGRRKKSAPALPPEDTNEKCKKNWMDNIQRVFGEAQSIFKERRQELDAMNLKRTPPKERKRQQKSEPVAQPVSRPPVNDLGGKAGKSQFIVHVGDVSNLYKTSKPIFAQTRANNIMLDLHGYTKDEALEKLDECLDEWVDVAMQQPPFVILVKIVCGGGSQVLAEVVESWIRGRENVANAPKSMYS